jgi:hypothetical protein
MSTVAEIEEAIEQLKPEQQLEVRNWILEKQPLEDNSDIVLPRAYRQKTLDALDQP